eukprot:XP_011678917.1 PREDICTED: vesicle transport through interaction with t-SNAREs homolog 1B [Strongylocentrotus purpuratus]
MALKERKKLVREVLRETEDLLVMVTGLENEASPAPGSFRTQLMGKVRSYRREVERLQKDAHRFGGQTSGRDELLSGGMYSAKSDFEAHQDTQKNRVIGGIESLNRTSQSLDRTQRIAAETDEIGVGILDELDGQKEQLIRTRERAHQDTQKNRVIGGIESLNRTSQSLDRTQRIAAETDEIGVGILDELDGQKEQLIRTRERGSTSYGSHHKQLILSGIILVELAILGVVIWFWIYDELFVATDHHRFGGQTSGRDELLSGGMYSAKSDFEAHQDTQKNRVIGGIESLNRTSQSLDRTQRIAAETDEIGVGILDELDGQKEQLIRTRERVEDIDDNLSRSKRILNSMARRVITNKLILSGIILVELAILGVVIWWKFFSK